MRWKFFFACLGLAVIALVASLVVGALLPHDANDLSGTAHLPTGQLLATADRDPVHHAAAGAWGRSTASAAT